jgi:hypothetical protein
MTKQKGIPFCEFFSKILKKLFSFLFFCYIITTCKTIMYYNNIEMGEGKWRVLQNVSNN